MSDRLGQQFGNYRLVSLLGQGGYAEVYLGQHVRLDLQAAIKVLHTHLTGQEAEHFQQEAQTIAKLTHPSIVRIFDFDVQDGVPFLVMDYAPNGSLRRRYPKGSLLPLPQIVSYVKQVAAALQYAHDRKFIHRDVKQENMLLGRHEEVLLSDFGLAALAHSSGSLSTKEAVGTLPYMAPEQIEGHPRAASDQYALGVVVYEWLCGARPFEGSLTEVMVQHLTMPPPPLHERVATIPLGIEQVVLRALAKDAKARFASVQDFATALEQASQSASGYTLPLPSEHLSPSPAAAAAYPTVAASPGQLGDATEAISSADGSRGALEPTALPVSSQSPAEVATPQSQAGGETPQSQLAASRDADTPAVLPQPQESVTHVQRKAKGLPRNRAALLIGLVVVVIAGGSLGSLSLLAHFGLLGIHSGATAGPVRGGTWTIASVPQPASLIPNGGTQPVDTEIDQALYLPLFYSDAFGVIHPGAASEVPTVQNGGINADATSWTFHLRPHLVWSDGQPYDARDADYTWRLWLNPQFPAINIMGLNLISSAVVSADHLTITFHLKQPFVPFLADLWVDGGQAPLPAHHYSAMAPGQILKSQDNLNPRVTSGPFLMAESAPGNHFTLVRNPRFYQASKGLPYLDKVVLRILSQDALNADLQVGTIDSTTQQSLDATQDYTRLHSYTLITPTTSIYFGALYFNFHNTVLASHLEVRQAIATALDYQALIKYENSLTPGGPMAVYQLCTDHSAFYHPGFDPTAPCPIFDQATANQLLDNNGWVKGPDGVRTKGGQRLEFELSAPINPNNEDRIGLEAIIQRNLQAVGIKLDIQNYPENLFFNLVLGGKASPPTGAVAGSYDIVEVADNLGLDPDDSALLSCNQFPPNGFNIDFYCNPALDALYKQELRTPDQGARQNIFKQIHLIYLTQFPFIVLFGEYDFYMVRKGTHNFQPSPLGFTDDNIWLWWCDNGKC